MSILGLFSPLAFDRIMWKENIHVADPNELGLIAFVIVIVVVFMPFVLASYLKIHDSASPRSLQIP